ncbi:MAG: plasmid recombination protein [Parabacteroides chartae]|nr:plasmid recombination protein [Parabacteroides chartae]
MGFVVLHIQKPKGNDSGTTAHIERTVSPANADPERTHQNKEFIEFPDGVDNRTQRYSIVLRMPG